MAFHDLVFFYDLVGLFSTRYYSQNILENGKISKAVLLAESGNGCS